MASRRDRRQVQAEAKVRYGPEQSQLSELLLQALEQRDHAIRVAHATAAGVTLAAQRARPELARTYGQAQQAFGDDAKTLDEQLARVGGAAGPFAAAIARERSTAHSRVEEARAHALGETTQRKVEAKAGEAFAVQNALASFSSDVAKVNRRGGDLASEIGAFAQGRLGELNEARSKRAVTRRGQNITAGNAAAGRTQSERNSLRSSGIDPDTGLPIPGGKLDPKAQDKKKNRLTPSELRQRRKEQAVFEDSVGEARAWIKRLGGASKPQDQLRSILTTGEAQIPDPADPTGKKQKTVKTGRYGPVTLDTALDLELGGGYVSRGTAKRIAARGLKTAVPWRRQRRRNRISRPAAPRRPQGATHPYAGPG